MKSLGFALGLIAISTPGFALASETITYTYDAQGRVVSATRAGGPSAGVQQQYCYDKADSRTEKKVTSSPSPPPSCPT